MANFLMPIYLTELGASVSQVGLVFTLTSVVILALQILGGASKVTGGFLGAVPEQCGVRFPAGAMGGGAALGVVQPAAAVYDYGRGCPGNRYPDLVEIHGTTNR